MGVPDEPLNEGRQKLGAPGRHHLRELEARPEAAAQLISLFLRGRHDFSPDELAQLAQDGARLRTRAGSVLTVDVPIDAVDRVLSHDFVVGGEVSAPLYHESDDAPYSDIG